MKLLYGYGTAFCLLSMLSAPLFAMEMDLDASNKAPTLPPKKTSTRPQKQLGKAKMTSFKVKSVDNLCSEKSFESPQSIVPFDDVKKDVEKKLKKDDKSLTELKEFKIEGIEGCAYRYRYSYSYSYSDNFKTPSCDTRTSSSLAYCCPSQEGLEFFLDYKGLLNHLEKNGITDLATLKKEASTSFPVVRERSKSNEALSEIDDKPVVRECHKSSEALNKKEPEAETDDAGLYMVVGGLLQKIKPSKNCKSRTAKASKGSLNTSWSSLAVNTVNPLKTDKSLSRSAANLFRIGRKK